MSWDEKLNSLEQIRRGDHIKTFRTVYSHHYIVENVDYWQGKKIHVIHYNNSIIDSSKDSSSYGSLARVKRDLIEFNSDSFYRIVYDKEKYSHDEVVNRALRRLNETKYNPLYNNCEHFATWCKNGEAESHQATTAKVSLGIAGILGIGALAYLAYQSDKEPSEESDHRRRRGTRSSAILEWER